MTNFRTSTIILSSALLISLSLTVCQAKDGSAHHQVPMSSSLASKLMPQTRARTSRSLSDMFEKVKSKIFGSRKQQAPASSQVNQQVQPASSINNAQRQPWGDMNSFNQQYNSYPGLSSSNYQWPQQYLGQQYSPLSGFSQSGSSAYPSITGAQSGVPSLISGVDNQQQQQQQQSSGQAAGSISQAANSNGAGGILSSASQLIAHYLTPSSSASAASSSSSPTSGSPVSSSQQNQFQTSAQGQHNLLNPQQQQQQSQYNEFASMLDSLVAQTGVSSQRQPSLSQYMSTGVQGASQSQQQQGGYQSAPNSIGSLGDTEMSSSSNVQSFMPAATQQQASQKSSMVSLAEQLAPGSQFNKLVSFPFSLSNNDDPSSNSRFKLHIPFLNQHVKRSDQQASNVAQQQQRNQQYLNSYYAQQQQQQQYANSLANSQQQQQLASQASQVVPTIVSPQASVAQPASVSSASSSSSSSSSSVSSASAANAPVSSSSSVSNSPSQPSSSLSNNPSPSSSVSASQSNSRPAWSVADIQSSASSSKLIPMPSAASSSLDSATSS